MNYVTIAFKRSHPDRQMKLTRSGGACENGGLQPLLLFTSGNSNLYWLILNFQGFDAATREFAVHLGKRFIGAWQDWTGITLKEYCFREACDCWDDCKGPDVTVPSQGEKASFHARMINLAKLLGTTTVEGLREGGWEGDVAKVFANCYILN